jgi:hypothetical protein
MVACALNPHGTAVSSQVRVPKGRTAGVVRQATSGIPGVAAAVIEMSASRQTT